MGSFRRDPYLWVHFAGLAALPLFLDICLLGLAAGYPVMPVWLEMALLLGIGILPVLWMQWQRPFYIFSLLAVAVKPEQLSEERRRMLPLFQSPQVKLLTGLGAIVWGWVLWQVYCLAPIAATITPFNNHLTGLGVAAVAFLGSNLFLQVPLSVLRVLWVSEQKLASVTPLPAAAIAQNFTILGLRLKQILPELQPQSAAIAAPPQPAIADDSPDLATVEAGAAPPTDEQAPKTASEQAALTLEDEATDATLEAAEGVSSTEGQAEAETGVIDTPEADPDLAETETDELAEKAGADADLSAEAADADAVADPVVLSPSEGQAEAEAVPLAADTNVSDLAATSSQPPADTPAALEETAADAPEPDVTAAATSADNSVVLSPSEGQAEVEAVDLEAAAEDAVAEEAPEASVKLADPPEPEAGEATPETEATPTVADVVDDENPVVLSPSEGQAEVETVDLEDKADAADTETTEA
ncbi:low-complexity tail membrane protein [Almyronema epifaneia]|uniref:Low-complexity tail membrane protein n=1 Tax=Almyronema epifaneia S1 TaxID=2991925 RepID=A0ABW6IF74_9CYAN